MNCRIVVTLGLATVGIGVPYRRTVGVASVRAWATWASSVGYADVAYALHNHLSFFTIKNRSGKFATPGLRGMLSAALSDAKPAADNSLSIVNPPKKFANAYPISTFTYVVVPLQSSKAPDLKKFLFWAVTKGQTYGPKLLFAPLPKTVLVVAEKAIAKINS